MNTILDHEEFKLDEYFASQHASDAHLKDADKIEVLPKEVCVAESDLQQLEFKKKTPVEGGYEKLIWFDHQSNTMVE